MNIVGKVKKVGNVLNREKSLLGRWTNQFFTELSFAVMKNDFTLFVFGFGLGAGLELIKNHLVIGKVSFYQTFREKNVPRELEAFEEHLKEREKRIEKSLKIMREENEK
uniref:Uncharacterized protein n=1 Tax=Meloidogyne hapla TaxID=6305 RepID=A0A1I8BSU0_MELHA